SESGLELNPGVPPQPSAPSPAPPCDDCGVPVPTWFAPSEVWNAVIPERVGMLCANCFIRHAEHIGFQCTGWELRPENPSEPVSHADPAKHARFRAAVQEWRDALCNAWASDHRAVMTALLEIGPSLAEGQK